MKILPTLLALTVVASATPLLASSSMTSDKPVSDQIFFEQAAQAGLLEVELGQLAAAQSGSEGVKIFGRQMVTDHGKANAELLQLAAKKGVTLPEQPNGQQQKLIADLHGKQGAVFDRLYLREAAVKGHQQAQALFEKAARSPDPDVQAFAEKTLPTIRHHLDMSRQLEGTTNAAYVKSLAAAAQVAAAHRE